MLLGLVQKLLCPKLSKLLFQAYQRPLKLRFQAGFVLKRRCPASKLGQVAPFFLISPALQYRASVQVRIGLQQLQ